MEIFVSHRLYNSYGGQKSISLVGDLLEYDIPDFGGAINELEITLHFYQDGPAKKTLEGMHEKFHENLKSLPKCTFFRKKRKLCLDFEGTFTTGIEIHRLRKPPICINPEWVRSTLVEISNQLPVIKSKLKTTDDFNFDSFESFISKKLETLPTEVSELERIQDIVAIRKKEAFQKLDAWQKLGIDWNDYHPNAREIVPLPYQWDRTDEFAPNGNDTGADILSLFQEWNKKNRNKNAMHFLESLLSNWEVNIAAPYSNEYSSQTFFQSVVGLAFASAKLRGLCEQELKELSVSAINKYLKGIEHERTWEYKEECKLKLEQAKETIEKMPNKIINRTENTSVQN